MKKYIYGCLVLAISCFIFVSCGDDDEPVQKGNAASYAAGVYSGIWEEVNQTTQEVKKEEGTLTITQSEEYPYVGILEFSCPNLKNVDAKITPANVMWNSSDFIVSNAKKVEDKTKGYNLNCAVDGRIDSWKLKLRFYNVIKPRGGKSTVYYFSFVGEKIADVSEE